MIKKLKRKQKIFIEALEQRIMLDGAGAVTFLDLIDDRNQQEIKKNSKIIDTSKENNEVPFANVARDQSRKSVVFIDSAVPDYETIISSFKENTEFYLINSNEDGFKKIDQILTDRKEIDALHIIGHGSAGEILFGNAFLNNDTIANYQATLASIGQSLTSSGDILFYGCNVASTDQGELLIKKISEITKADIAASDDITGKGGDWDLEKEEGFIDVKELKVQHYDHSLGSLSTSGVPSNQGITHKDNNVTIITSSSSNTHLGLGGVDSRDAPAGLTSVGDGFGLAVERLSVSVASGKLISQVDIDTDYTLSMVNSGGNTYLTGDADQNASSSLTVNSYLMFLGSKNKNPYGGTGGSGFQRRSSSYAGEVVFDGEIVGIFFDQARTRGSNVDGVTYYDDSSFTYDMDGDNQAETNTQDADGGRIIEPGSFFGDDTSSTNSSGDWVSVGDYGSGTNNYLRFGAENGNTKTGDYIRILVVPNSNSNPVAVNDTDSITEGATEDVKSDGNHLLNDDTDADSDSLVVTHIRSGSNSDQAVSSGTNYSNGTSITTSYGTLVVGADGTYRYTASGSASNALAAGATATDTFTYTISDGNGGTDTATLIYTITGVNDNPSATADTGYIAEDSTLTVADGASANDANSDGNNNSSTGDHTGDVLGNDTDADTANTLTITSITATTAGGSAQTTFTSNTETVTGSYGTLTINSNGSYSYAATADAADALDAGDTITDVFTYIVSDGTATATSTLTITIAGINDAPVAQDDVGVIVEGGTLTVANSANANVSGSYDATGEHSGDVIDTSSASHSDSDADASSSLTVTAIRKGQEGGSGDSGTVGVALTGTYGQLTIAADGSYSYIANQSAANALAAGESANDYFTYTVSDGTATDTAQITITVLGSNDAPSATADTGYIQEGKTLTVADGASANDADSSSNTNDATGDHSGDISANDTDPDTNDTLTITTYSHTSSTGQGGAAGGSNSNSGTAGTDSVVGAYGTLDLEANGSYTYTANSDITDLETDDETFTDVFTYTLSDGTTTTTATITITIEASGDVTAQNDTGTVNEDATLTVSNSGNATSVTAATHDSSPFDVSSQTSTPYGLAFNDDGTKMFVMDPGADDIEQYTLSTAFDVSTASFERRSETPGNRDSDVRGMVFNNDGTKLFYVGQGYIYPNTLSTAYDVISVSNESNLDIRSQDTDPRDVKFNNDGTKMFVLGGAGNDVNEYTLSTAFNLSTASYSQNFSLSSQVSDPSSITFNNDGKKMFVVDSGTDDDINEYTLSTAFNVSTASYVGNFSISSEDSDPKGLVFNNDGTKMFVVGASGDDINEYSLTTPFSLVDVSGENTGDVIDTSSGSNSDSDADSDTLTITAIRTGSSEGSGTAGTVGAALDGTYGQLTINANGSYTYVANKAAADALDPGDTVTDTFNYTVSDGNGEDDIAVLTITVIGINDAPTAVDDTDSVTAGNTVTDTTNSAGTLVSDDTDPDASSSLYITQVTPSGGSASQLTYNSTKTSNATNISGSKGTLTIGSDGSYSYAANSDATTGNDVFTYTLTDGTSTTTATLTISVTAISNNAPTASNSTVYINENNQVSSAGDRTPSNITKIFAASDFNYSDADSDSLSKIQITTLESAGALEYSSDGSTWTDVTLNQEITATDIGNNKLRFTPAANSESDVTFGFKVHDGTEYSSSAYTMTISVNAAPNVTDTTVAGTVSAGATTSSADIHDIVADSDDADSVLVVTGVASGNESSNNTIITDDTGVGSAVSGTYGSLTVAANGTYTYTASATNSIAFGATATDTFTFTTRDNETNSGSFAYDVGTITFTVGSSISLTDDTDSVNEDATVTKTGAQDDVLNDDTADSNGLVVTHIKKDGGSNSAVTSGSTYNSSGTSVTGTYGTLTIGADGSYTYTADQAAADALDAGDTVTDVFVYTADGDTANLTITVTGINDAPVAQNDVGVIVEGGTLTVANSANANRTGSWDVTGEHSGDIIDTSSASHTDSDADDSASLTITEIRTGSTENAGTAGTVGVALTGTYGQLTINANGSYSYVANQAAADALDSSDSTATDYFNYTLSDGTDTDFGVISFVIIGENDAPTAVNDTDTATEGSVTTVTGSEDDVLNDDSDVDVETITVTNISHTNGNDESVTASTTYSNGQSIAGTYGTLVIGADGSYEFTPNDVLGASETGNDVFTYTVSDGTATDTATLTITTTGANDAPVAQNDTGTVNENATLSVSNGDNATTVTGVSNDTGSPYAINEGTVRSVTFNHDGTKMFVVHAANGTPKISEHALTTAFDIDTASQSTTYDISSHLTEPRGIRFNNDGTKLYISSGANSDKKIYEFSLSTAYDVSSLPTATETSISGQDSGPRGFSFNADGTKMFLIGDTNNAVYEYSLSTAFDTTTISYTNRSLDISAKEVTPRGLSFNPTGTKLFITGQNSDDILEYDLSTGFNLSTATFNGAFDVSSFATKPNDIVFNNDGTKAFMARANNNGVRSFSLTSPYSFIDISGEHTGDVLDTSSSSNSDSDADTSDTLTVSAIRTGGTEGAGTAGSVGSALTGTYGQLTINANGSYSYVANTAAAEALDAGDIVTDQFNYTVSDGTATDTAVITITVIGINDAPVAVNDTDSVNEDATVTQSSGSSLLAADDTDVDASSATLTITQISKTGGSNSTVSTGSSYNSSGTQVTGTYGQLTVGADGTYTYVANQSAADDLDAGDQVTDSFTYTVSDGITTDTATLIITVTGINDAPVADNETGAVNEDATLTVTDGTSDLLHGDTDADDSASLTVTQIAVTGGSNSSVASSSSYNSNGTSITGTYGTLTVGADGTYTYVADQSAADALDASDTVTDSFTYTMSDGTATDTATLIITVTGVNDDPVGVADTDAVQVSSTVTDTTNSAGTVISDDTDADDSSSLTVTAIQHSGAGSATSVSAGTTRADGASSVGTYGTLTIGADGSYSYVAGSSAGTDVFTYTVSDGTATATTTLTFTVSNGNPPVGVNDTDSVNEDATVTQSSGASLLVADDTDADGNSLTVSQIAVTGGSNSAVSSGSTYNSSGTQVTGTYGQLTVGADGSYTYTANQSAADDLDAGDTVTDSFTYTVSDGTNTDTATLIITVTGVNDDPVAVNDTDAVNEDATVTHLTNSAGTLISDDTDADDSASLTVTQIAVTGGSNSSVASSSSYNSNGTSITGTYGTLVVGADGTYSYIADQSAADDLDASDTATDSFTYTVSDGTATDTATIIITVTGINDAPVAVNDTDAVNEDATVTQSSGSSLLMADDTDADDDDSFTVTQIAVTGGSNSAITSGSSYNSNGKTVTGTYGQLTVGADGTYTYVANQSAADDLDAGDTVTDSFTYTISDGDATDTATLIITVTGVNDDPVADNETGAVNEDATLTVTDGTSDLLHGDTDADDSASLTISAIRTGAEGASGTAGSIGSGLTGTYGTLTVAADGTYTYIADQSAADDLDAGDTATDVFTYTVSDGTATDTATLTITITGVNDAPVAVNDTGAVNEDATLTVSSAASGVVQDNDTDPDTDDTAASLVVSQIAVSGGSNSAVNSGSTYNSGTPTTVTGTYGQLTIGADGTYTYVANQSAADDLDASDTATDSFTYTISDGTATDTATLIITVTGVNDVPTASNKTVTTNEDTAYVFSTSDFGYTDADDDDALVSIKITTLEDAGALQYYNGSTWVDVTLNQVITATDIAANKLRFNPAADENGSSYTTFNFTVNDGDSDSATPNTITVNVTPVNDAPVADNETGAVNEDATLTVTDGTSDVLHGDTDADSDTLTVTLIGIGTNSDQAVASSSTYNSNGTTVTGTYGQLTIGADGTYTYVANQSAADDLDGSDTATDTFTYTVSDGNGGTDTATLTFTVTGVNDVPTAADNTVTTTEDTPYVFSTSDFGYTDADDDDALVSVKITTLEDDGALQYYNGTTWTDVTLNQVITTTDISNGYLRLNPDANDNGSPYTTFAFTVNDGDADSATPNTMTINVTAANDDPVADNESNSVTEGNTLTVTDGSDDLLDGDTDTEGDTLTVSGIRTGRESGSGTSGTIGSPLTGTYGTLTVNSDGTYTYTPNDILGAGDTGREYFTYTVSDGNGGTDTAELAFVVTGINDDPVATNDSNTIDISTSSTLTATNNSIKDVLTNDSDVDVGDTLTVSAIRTGATEGAGTAGTIGSGLEGTYGTLTMNANGSYTYVVNAGLKDTLDPGQIVFEYFNYTLADDNSGTDTGSIIVKLQNGGAKVNEIKEQKAEKRIEKKIKKESKNTIRKLKVEGDNEAELRLNKFEFEKTKRKTSYSQGLKLVDLVAETESVQLSDGALAKVNAKEKSDALKLNFKVMNEIDNEIIKFEGKMADGSDLPSWIKVNSKTGKTTTTIPEGVDKLDIIIIATDKKNETREITIEIDPEQIKRDKQIVKVAKKVNALISVGSDGNINLIRQKADGTLDTVRTQNLNFNNQTDIRDIIEAFKPERTFQLRAINNGTDIAINLSTEILGSFERTKLVLKDGSEVPEWLEYDQATGEIIAANPPEDLSLLELKLIIERDGEIIVKDLEIDLGNTDVSEFIDLEEKNKFVAFNDQLEREFNDWDDYGNNFINRL